MAVENGLVARRALMELSKDDLQDKHLRLMEENMTLKKHARSQEDKMKRMATKLLKLTADDKGHGNPKGRVDEDKYGEMEVRLMELEKKNQSLTSKNLVLKHQLESKSRRHTPYDHIQSRISSGVQLPTPKKSQKIHPEVFTAASSKSRVMLSEAGTQCNMDTPVHQRTQTTPTVTPTCHNVLEEVRKDNNSLEAEVIQLKSEMIDLAAENVTYKEKLRLIEKQLEEEKLVVKKELQEHIAQLQSDKTDKDVEMLKVQRQVRDSNNRLQNLRTKYNATEKNLEVIKLSNTKMLDELERLNTELREERARVIELEVKVRSHDSDRQAIATLDEVVSDLKRERDSLKASNRDLTEKVELSSVRHKAKVRSLQEQVRSAEEASHEANTDRTKTHKLLTAEREVSRELDEELRETRDLYHKLKDEFNTLQDRLKFFDKETSVDWSEVEEALAAMRAKKEQGEDMADLGSVDKRVHEEELQEVRAWHADTVNELEKTRKLLQMQHTINKDYKAEVESLKAQLEEQETRHHDDMKEKAKMMDIKTARATELESRLKDIAYGTRQYKLEGRTSVEDEGAERDVVLEHGQNLLQFGLNQLSMSSQALVHLSTSSPSVFMSIQFCDYEVQVTPVVQGPRPNFGFTASFVVTVDDAFMQHLQKGSVRVELHQALGLKYQPLGFCQVKCRDLIGAAGGKFHGRGQLIGMEPLLSKCVDIGSFEFWMKLKIPITHSAKLYQDRSKAQALIDAQPVMPISSHASSSLSHGPDYNQLTVTITSCQGLAARDSAHFPSPYVVYKFYSFPDHDTDIVSNSVSPNFQDVQHFPVSMDSHLHLYLESECLEVYVFDDSEQEGEEELPGYMGVARVPLHDLSQGKHVSGSFQLEQLNGEPGGVVMLSMHWKLPYSVSHFSLPEKPQAVAIPISSPHHAPISRDQQTSHDIPTTVAPSSKQLTSPQLPTIQSEEFHPETRQTDLISQLSGQKDLSTAANSRKVLQKSTTTSSEISPTVKSSTKHDSKPKKPPSGPRTSEKNSKSKHNVRQSSPLLNNSLPPLRKPPSSKTSTSSTNVPNKTEVVEVTAAQPVEDSEYTDEYNTDDDFDQTSSEEGGSVVKEPAREGQKSPTATGSLSNTKVGNKGSDARSSKSASSVVIQKSSQAAELEHIRSLGQVGKGSSLPELSDFTEEEDEVKDVALVVTPAASAKKSNDQLTQMEPRTKSMASDIADDSRSFSSVSEMSRTEWEESMGVAKERQEEEVDEELEEEVTDEDTMFEETLHDYQDDKSELSDHSSNQVVAFKVSAESRESGGKVAAEATTVRVQPVSGRGENQEEEEYYSSDGTLTESEVGSKDGKPITSHTEKQQPVSKQSFNKLLLSIDSFTMEQGSSISSDATIGSVFIECEFLDFDTAELETQSVAKPAEGKKVELGFRKELVLSPDQLAVLATALKARDQEQAKISFMLVSDPGDEGNCEELGIATYNLHNVLQNGRDLYNEDIDVIGLEDDSEVVGFLTLSVVAHKLLTSLSVHK